MHTRPNPRSIVAAAAALAVLVAAGCAPPPSGGGGGGGVTANCTQVDAPIRIGSTVTGLAKTTCTFSRSIELRDVDLWLMLNRANGSTAAIVIETYANATGSGTTFTLQNVLAYDSSADPPSTQYRYAMDIRYKGSVVASTVSPLV